MDRVGVKERGNEELMNGKNEWEKNKGKSEISDPISPHRECEGRCGALLYCRCETR